MAIHWDDIEILQMIDEGEHGNSSAVQSGLALMQTVANRRGERLDPNTDYASFVHELVIGRAAGLVAYDEMTSLGITPPSPANPNDYLQRTWQISLTIAGRDRARGRVVQVELPDPAEDDGRLIRGSTLEDVARSIGDAYTGTQLARFLAESGIPGEWVPEFDGGTKWVFVHEVLTSLAEGSSAQRRELRRFVGAWLDDRLHSGPQSELRGQIVRDLARQGWFISDGRLLIGDPVYASRPGRSDVALPVRLDALHPRIIEVSRPLFEQQHRAAAILQAYVAVNNRVKEMTGLTTDGVDLMARVFRPEDPVLRLADLSTETGRNIQMGYHRMYMGVMAALRNPKAHELFDEVDEDEALEQLFLASLLMRRLDEAVVSSGT